MMLKKTYEKATLYDPKGEATWFVIWYNLNPATGKLQRVRKTFNLNRISDRKERKAVAAALITVINTALANGWNVFAQDAAPPDAVAVKVAAPKTKEGLPFLKAFERAYDAKVMGNKPASVASYRSISNLFKKWLIENELHEIPAADFTSEHFFEYMLDRHAQGHGARNLNAHINLVKAVCAKMVKPLKIIKVNPLAGYEKFPEEDSSLFEPFSKDELARISGHLQEHDPLFALYTQIIYYGFIRPAHITHLQAKQFDFANDLILIRGTNTKNRKNTSKQLLRPLKEALIAAGVHQLPGDHYLFGSKFLPSATPLKSLYARADEKWTVHVKEKLQISKHMYALKHTAATLYIDENEEPNAIWLQRQMEHSSLAETQAYIQKRKTKKITEDKTPFVRF